MTMRFARAALTACLLGTAALAAVTVSTAPAVAAKPTGPGVSAPVGKLLQQAAPLLATDPKAAMDLIKQAQALPDPKPFDTYKINEFLGQAAIKLNDHATAATAYEAMAESPSLADVTPDERAQTLRIAALLANEVKHYDKGIKYALAFNALGGAPDPLILTSLAEAYYFTNDFADADATAQKVIDATPAGQAPDRNAIEILLESKLKAKKQDEAIAVLEKMVTYYDDPDYWNEIIENSTAVRGIKDTELLHIYRLRLVTHAKGHPDDYTLSAQLALSLSYPVEALAIADASDGGVKQVGQLADLRGKAAKDRSIVGQFDALAKKSPTGELSVKLAETYYGYGNYAQAEDAARAAIAKGGAKTDVNEANMVLGEALLAEGKTADAVAAFNALKNPSPGYARAQHLWLLYANRKYASAEPAPAAH
jgi:hypothetical protein